MNNAEYAEMLKSILGLRYEPVAVRLVRENEPEPVGYEVPEKQLSHCQAVMAAKNGKSYYVPADLHGCNNGASTLGMKDKPEKVASGEFYYDFGMHDTLEGAAAMVATRAELPFKTKGSIVTPLAKADFVPDSVIIVDVPEVIYWFVPLKTHKEGGRAHFTTAPFNAVCGDATAFPIINGDINVSMGCFGCRRRSDIKKDEMIVGIPGSMLEDVTLTLKKYKDGVLSKAKRD
jgi:uncharacterized protein (DUF169 family)